MMDKNEWTEIVYNGSYGGFYLSDEAVDRLRELKGDRNFNANRYYEDDHRTDPDLIQVVHELGSKVNGLNGISDLRTKEIKKGEIYRIDKYDGLETIVTAYDDWKVA